ncbi:helix-turn-helix domain-containing protein [Streptomyces turgidiscabies]|uniref:Transposase n=1 Tax=Streptomyces turgidiscabies TaxID=85558 RepID=A0ABU0RMS9_9ACTN|nr:transposase family protein [Streptomyces turgidiscabies]MDQ0933290.1 hypothetical protein [Streptomyces turgidiscabies]
MVNDTTLLLGLGGVSVVRVESLADGTRRVHLITADEAARACPSCGVIASRVKGPAVTRPRDLPYWERRLEFFWHKRRWWCREPNCPRKSFTESIAQIPAGARITARLREAAGHRVRDAGSTVIQAARDLRLSWPTVMGAFRASAREVARASLPEVRVLGIDETRRGKTKWEQDPDSGKWHLVRDRWHTGFVDALGTGGLLGLRAADEDDPNSWKRFQGDNAKLVVTYNTRPDKPAGERLTNPDEKTCTTDNTKRPWIRDATPTMSVTGTDADSHTDGSGQNLTATFQVGEQDTSRPLVYEGKDGPQNEGRFEKGIPVRELKHGGGYRWRAQTYDGSTGYLENSGHSPWSDWCEFVVDVERPDTEPHVQPVAGEADLPAGTKRHFTFSANGNSDSVFKNDVEFYEWDLGNDTPTRKADPPALGGKATIEVAPSTFGPNVLYVRSVDRAGNRGPLEKYFFTVDRACADALADICAAAVYGLDQTSGTTAPDASGHNRTLTVKGADWVAGHNFATTPADRALRFNGTTDHATAVSPVHTGQAFTVSVWARPTSLAKNISVISQAGSQGNGPRGPPPAPSPRSTRSPAPTTRCCTAWPNYCATNATSPPTPPTNCAPR